MNCLKPNVEQHDIIEILEIAETREVGIHSQAVVHRLMSGDHEKDGWQGKISDKALLMNFAGLEEEDSHCCRKSKNTAQMLLSGGGGSTYGCLGNL